ncbi:DNA polymerase III subunit delta [Glacieibacterium sp.]|uniref:DNA polymerase III subunit delta n=1 Tax=Glacieibacterium sp. TaxID=2860237 RepID=UPI003AFFCCC4
MKADRAAVIAAAAKLPEHVRLILLHGGDESASMDLAQRVARGYHDASNPLSVEVIPAAEIDKDPSRLVAAAANVSMFGDRTLVRVDGAGEDSANAVAALLDASGGGNLVVMVAGQLRKGSKLLARAEAAKDVLSVASYPPDARNAVAAVEEIARELGLTAGRGAARAVFDASGADRAVLRRELEKLALYLDASVAQPQTFELDDLNAIGADVGDAGFSALVESVAGGDPATADLQLNRLMTQGMPGITLLRTVARRFWQLLDLRQAVDGGSSPSSAVDGARPPVFWKDKGVLAAEVARLRTPMLRNILARLLATERAIKRSGSAGEVLCRQALIGIATQIAGTR